MIPVYFITVALIILVTGGVTAATADLARRNVVLMIADDLGLDLGCYGNTKVHTPNLDTLARNGVRFSNGFSTVSSCSPSRAVILTGLFSHSNGQYGLAHEPTNQHSFFSIKSLPRRLRAAGYRTGLVGKLHVEPKDRYPFDTVHKGEGGNRDVTEMAEKAKQFFSESNNKPFFLLVGFGDPHRTSSGFGSEKNAPATSDSKYDPSNIGLPYFLPDQPEVRKELSEYYQAVGRMDRGVGLILEALRQTKNTDSTLVIFVSDNGVAFPGAKTNLYDSGIHLPLILSAPIQKKRGITNEALVSWIDIAPTVIDWTEGSVPAGMFGRSLLPILDQERPTGWDTVYGSHQFHEITMYYPMRMIRTRQFKYILNLAHSLEYPTAGDLYDSLTWKGILRRGDTNLGQRSMQAYLHRAREELYDLEQDPNELKNVAGVAKYADVLAELRTRLREWQKKTADPWTVKYQHE